MYCDYMLQLVQIIYIYIYIYIYICTHTHTILQYLIRQISTAAKFTAVFAHQQRYSVLLMLTERSINE